MYRMRHLEKLRTERATCNDLLEFDAVVLKADSPEDSPRRFRAEPCKGVRYPNLHLTVILVAVTYLNRAPLLSLPFSCSDGRNCRHSRRLLEMPLPQEDVETSQKTSVRIGRQVTGEHDLGFLIQLGGSLSTSHTPIMRLVPGRYSEVCVSLRKLSFCSCKTFSRKTRGQNILPSAPRMFRYLKVALDDASHTRELANPLCSPLDAHFVASFASHLEQGARWCPSTSAPILAGRLKKTANI